MSPERFAQLAAAYGGDVRRWPERDRLIAAALLAETTALRSVLAAEDALDAVLTEASRPVVSPALRARLITAAPVARQAAERLWNWWSGVGLAGACAAGVVLGLAAHPMSIEEPTTLSVLSPYDPGVVAGLDE